MALVHVSDGGIPMVNCAGQPRLSVYDSATLGYLADRKACVASTVNALTIGKYLEGDAW